MKLLRLICAALWFLPVVACAQTAISSITFGSNPIIGGNQTTITVLLSAAAPAGGATVNISSNDSDITVPTTVFVAVGQTSGTAFLTSLAISSPATATITATWSGSTKTATLTINPAVLIGVAVNPGYLIGGVSSVGTVTLNGQAPPGGDVVSVSSSLAEATVPASVTVPAGMTSANFTITTAPTGGQQIALITAVFKSVTMTTTLSANPPQLISVSVNPGAVVGGNSTIGTVTFAAAAPTPWSVRINFTQPVTGTINATVPAGQTSGTFTINTPGVSSPTNISVFAALAGIAVTAGFTINPATVASVSVSPKSVVGGTASTGTVTLNGQAGPSGSVVTLTSSLGSATVPQTMTIPGGASSGTFSISTTAVASQTVANIIAAIGAQSQTAPLSITPPVISSMSVTPSALAGGASSAGVVTLSGSVGSAGATILLSSNNQFAVVPTSIQIGPGQSSATFTASTVPVGTAQLATITASIFGSTQTAALTINPPALSTLSLSPTVVAGGTPSTGTVTISSAAPAAGLLVNLGSSNPRVTVPPMVTVPTGQTSASFTITTAPVAILTTASISASFGTVTQSSTLTVTPPALASLTMSPKAVLGGQPSTGTVTITGPAPPSGVAISLSSSSAVVTVPLQITVSSGQTTSTFSVATPKVSSNTVVTITATDGTISSSANLTYEPLSVASIALDPTTVGGGVSSTGSVVLNGPAPTGGATVTLASSSPDAKVPASVKFAAGETSQTFQVKTVGVSAQTMATITAKFATTSQSALLTITAPSLVSLSLKPFGVIGTGVSTGTVTVTGDAPAGGLKVTLATNSGSATVPVSVEIASGKSTATFEIKTLAVGSQTVATITASLNGVSQSAILTVSPAILVSLSLSPGSVKGGAPATGTVTLSGPAPEGGAEIQLSSRTGAATVPVSVKIPAGATKASFTVKSSKITTKQTATISASYGGVTETATLTIS